MDLHRADLRIITQDPLLPGLRLLLDNHSLLTALRHLPGLQEILSVTLSYLRYKPGTSCAAGLLVTFASQGSQHYFAKALTSERFNRYWQRQAAGSGSPPLALRDWAIMLQTPADDPAMPSLSMLQDDTQRQLLFSQLLPSLCESVALNWQFLRYKPEKRSVILLSCAQGPLALLRCASGKTYDQMLHGATVAASLGHVSLLASCPRQRILLTGWIAGNSLGPETGGALDPKTMTAAGVALAKIHNTPLSPSHQHRLYDNIHALWSVLSTLVIIHPAGATAFRTMTHQITRQMGDCPRPPVLLHGDFSADQLIQPTDGSPLKIIDWDRCAYGSPLNDLASFQARLELQVIQQIVPRQRADAAMTAFLQGYASAYGSVDHCSLSRYSAAALLCLATEPFRVRAINWLTQIDALLGRAWQLLFPNALAEDRQPQDLLPQLSNPALMATPLTQALILPAESDLQHCRVIRHKPGRRAIIEYQFALPNSPQPSYFLGKYSHKGVGSAAFGYQKILWQQGWDSRARFAVAEPLALLPIWNSWLQRKVTGTALTEHLIPGEPLLPMLGQQAGEALAALHQHRGLQQAVAAKTWHLADELRVLASGLKKVTAANPHWQVRIERILSACEEVGRLSTMGKTSLVHRDFYPDQILVNATLPLQLTLLDFDLCCISSPALDVGNYLAHVRELALRKYGDIQLLQAHEQAFVSAYLIRCPDVEPLAISAFTTLSLVRHIFLSTQFSDRHHTTEQLMTICERNLSCQ